MIGYECTLPDGRVSAQLAAASIALPSHFKCYTPTEQWLNLLFD